MKDLKDFPVSFYIYRFYDNSNPSASFNFSRFGVFLAHHLETFHMAVSTDVLGRGTDTYRHGDFPVVQSFA